MNKTGYTLVIKFLLLNSFLPFNYLFSSATTNYRQWLPYLFKPHKNKLNTSKATALRSWTSEESPWVY